MYSYLEAAPALRDHVAMEIKQGQPTCKASDLTRLSDPSHYYLVIRFVYTLKSVLDSICMLIHAYQLTSFLLTV